MNDEEQRELRERGFSSVAAPGANDRLPLRRRVEAKE